MKLRPAPPDKNLVERGEILDAVGMSRVLRRIAFEIIERNGPAPYPVGIGVVPRPRLRPRPSAAIAGLGILPARRDSYCKIAPVNRDNSGATGEARRATLAADFSLRSCWALSRRPVRTSDQQIIPGRVLVDSGLEAYGMKSLRQLGETERDTQVLRIERPSPRRTRHLLDRAELLNPHHLSSSLQTT